MSTHNSELVRFVPAPTSLPAYVDQLDKAGETILQLVDKAAGVAEQNSSRALTIGSEVLGSAARSRRSDCRIGN
jgi:hypothetical protein